MTICVPSLRETSRLRAFVVQLKRRAKRARRVEEFKLGQHSKCGCSCQTSLPCIKIGFMILNLSKRFAFNRQKDQFNVDYLFTKQPEGNICLTLNISLNLDSFKTIQLSKPTSVLYQSNELIEKMIEEETVLLWAEGK
jgi:hypothetical protein